MYANVLTLLNQIAQLAQSRRLVRLGYKRPGERQPAEYLVEPYRLHRTAASPPALHAWQVSPLPAGHGVPTAWRSFRLDRITSADDAGQTFEPRIPITLPADAGAAEVTDPSAAGEAPAPPPPDAESDGPAMRTGVVPDVAAMAPIDTAAVPAAATRFAGGSPFAAFSDRPIGDMSPAEHYFQQLETVMLDGEVTPEELEVARELGGRVPAEERRAVHARIYANVLQEVLQDGRIAHREELYLRQVRQLLERLGWAP